MVALKAMLKAMMMGLTTAGLISTAASGLKHIPAKGQRNLNVRFFGSCVCSFWEYSSVLLIVDISKTPIRIFSGGREAHPGSEIMADQNDKNGLFCPKLPIK